MYYFGRSQLMNLMLFCEKKNWNDFENMFFFHKMCFSYIYKFKIKKTYHFCQIKKRKLNILPTFSIFKQSNEIG